MTEENRRQLAAYVSGFRLPRYRELPDIGLRLEQVTRYASRYVPAPVTGSMVSNYVKQRLIPGSEKKSYSRDSIAYLLLLSYIKTVMSLDDIRLMTQVQRRSYDLETAYDYFCAELENPLRLRRQRRPQRDRLHPHRGKGTPAHRPAVHHLQALHGPPPEILPGRRNPAPDMSGGCKKERRIHTAPDGDGADPPF